jgi:bifunctional UDP-N-acetylglucosamine pyrophosphorylase/glucosamine-1-phosphate N-acetyltransferase
MEDSGPTTPRAERDGAVTGPAERAREERRGREERLARLMDHGVVVEDPSTTHVGPEVEVEAGARLRPFTMLEGRTVVRGRAVVGPFARLVDVEVGAGAQILDHCLLRECVVEEEASVGPFSHVRPATRIGAGARVGNFVELKKTHLGEGSKASHLTYLGDAEVGPGVNIGAGTITCNYDGVHKHPTRIDAGAFVGSDSILVAPVTVGEGAYVAAGSTVTQDVPGDALALGRARQVNKPGWAARLRAVQAERKKKG